ncbi:bumetanide-sensitive sodium-(potassium)-chloride cotransporter-like [Artemia franciscana]|uniref:Uncharacterized protein n=1 Tax=Artemia franciscana TaxID=6661 RepID=A0AA88HCY3_ARTSF|nr:hypothetical protein QYM36_013407 [Artemia franciscana]KAK2709721.1 hypothetical protein QYM36_013407 [Artemia franciscana]
MDNEGKHRFKVDAVQGGKHDHDVELGKIRVNDALPNDSERAGSPAALLTHHNPYTNTVQGVGTMHQKSWRHFTREALPNIDNYRNLFSLRVGQRPTLDELHNPSLGNRRQGTNGKVNQDGLVEPTLLKFGWIKGVLVRCLLCIWGVMLFLRLSWVVGQAGVIQGIVVILLATSVTIITSISMSAISTNGSIKGGGTYFMISRSLGPEFGASIGVIFSIANAVAVAMYIIGFCESLNDLLKTYGLSIIDNDINDTRIIGTISIIFITGIVVIGMEWEAKAQIFLLGILIIAMADFVVGSIIGPMSDEDVARGFTGYSGETLLNNLAPDYRYSEGVEHSFFTVFAVYFPAATGILAGANISGDLKDPSESIPKGTLTAILISSVTYIAFAIICGATVVRDATGNVLDLVNGTIGNATACEPGACEWGLENSFQVIEMVSAFGPLIYAGCFAATLSSALASLVSAPKVFQALCNDNLYPYIGYFGKGFGKNNEPVRGYVLTFIIALGCILIGELNAIAPLISNFFLAAYALINFSTFHVTLVKPVGWRPTFRYYKGWISLLGTVLCVAVMFLMNWPTALITFGCLLCLYLLIVYRKPDVNWGSSTQAQIYKSSLASVYQLVYLEEHIKNYRPQILILSGNPASRSPLIDFANLICKKQGLMLCGHITKDALSQRQRSDLTTNAYVWLKSHKIRSFYAVIDKVEFSAGVRVLIQSTGLGKMRPNILMMGYKSSWITKTAEELNEYFWAIHAAFDNHISVVILRSPQGLDYSDHVKFLDPIQVNKEERIVESPSTDDMEDFSTFSVTSQPGENSSQSQDSPDKTIIKSHSKRSRKDSTRSLNASAFGENIPRPVLDSLTQFRKKQQKGYIDVWWLYDDGGLSLLLPYILTTRQSWSGSKLRVFCIANKSDQIDMDQQSMAALLSKFRIDFADVIAVPDVSKKPKEETIEWFEQLIRPYKADESAPGGTGITQSELLALKDKTYRHMRLRELLQHYSMKANLVVMTLPIPQKGTVSAPLYMAWLETLTKDMPPFMLVRGNQTSVLTFYS